MSQSAIRGLGLMATLMIATNPAAGALNSKAARPPVIATHARYYRYSPEGGAREGIAWVHIDLGTIRPIDAVRMRPASASGLPQDPAPVDFCVACSVDSAFQIGRASCRVRVCPYV